MVAPRLLALFAFGLTATLCLAQATDATLQTLLSRYEREPANGLLCEQIGVLYTRLNELGKAADFFQKAVALNPQRLWTKQQLDKTPAS